MNAPELKLDAESFVSIAPMSETQDWSSRKRGVVEKDPPPEKYSIEWYVLEGEKNKRAREIAAAEAADVQQQTVIAGAALVISTAALIAVKTL